jgi:hypothetical protein
MEQVLFLDAMIDFYSKSEKELRFRHFQKAVQKNHFKSQ